MKNILNIWFKELTTVMRDGGILIFIIFVPIAYPLLYSYVYTNEAVLEVPLAAVDDCNSSLSRDLLRKLDATSETRVVARCNDMAEAEEMLKRQEVYGILHIPESFSRDLWRGDQTTVGLYCDMSSMLYYKQLLLSTSNVSLAMNRDIKVGRYLPGTSDRQDAVTAMPIEYDDVSLYNPQGGFASFLIPPVLMLILQQTLLLGIGMAMGNVRERTGGLVMPRLCYYRCPVQIVVGKTLFYLPLYIIMAVYMYVLVNDMFALPRYGGFGTFLAFLMPYLLACIFLGITLSALVYRREDCIMLFVFLSVPMLFLSGVSWPLPSMPAFWKYVSWLFPSTFGMNGYVRISSMGASLTDVLSELRGLWIQVAVYFTTSCLLYHRHLRRNTSLQNQLAT